MLWWLMTKYIFWSFVKGFVLAFALRLIVAHLFRHQATIGGTFRTGLVGGLILALFNLIVVLM